MQVSVKARKDLAQPHDWTRCPIGCQQRGYSWKGIFCWCSHREAHHGFVNTKPHKHTHLPSVPSTKLCILMVSKAHTLWNLSIQSKALAGCIGMLCTTTIQTGRYMNHAQHVNAEVTRPVFARGKWRIGFMAVRY